MTGRRRGRPPVLLPVELPLEAEEFLNWLRVERGRAPATLAAYRRDLGDLMRWLNSNKVGLLDVSEADLDRYLHEAGAGELAPSTRKRRAVAARSLFRFLSWDGVLDDDPSASLEVPRVSAGLPKALTEVEVTALLDEVVGSDPPASRDRAMLEVLYGSGVRISELVGLSLGDLDLTERSMRVLGKGSKERLVPLGRMSVEALTEWLDPEARGSLRPKRPTRDDDEAVFLNLRGRRLSRQGAWGVVRRYGSLAGLDGRLTPHVLRHSCATHLLDHGADIRVVQELLGHASVSTTQIYTKVTPDRLFGAYRAAHPRATRPIPSSSGRT